MNIKRVGTALALGGVLSVGGVAVAGPANAASTMAGVGGTTSVRPAAWTYADVSFVLLPDCQKYGQNLVNEGIDERYNCLWDDYYDMWDLYVYVS